MTVNQSKELTLLGLTANSAKAPEFRKRMVELYLLDAYDEHSGQDVLEHATLTPDERKSQKFWNENLRDILELYCLKQPLVRHFTYVHMVVAFDVFCIDY